MALEKKVALITGAAQGIGKSIAQRLADEGASVIVADLNLEKAQQTVAQLNEAGHEGIALAMNVSDEAAVNAAVERAVKELGPINILVNNAGILGSTPALEVDMDRWQLNLDVMLTGSLLCARAVLPHMIVCGWGRIINMGSLMGSTAFGQDVAYCSSKSAVEGLTRSLAAEFGPDNICVNTVCPGNILTDMLMQVGEQVEQREGLEAGSFIKDRAQAIPLKRLGQPEDIANTVAFLCSSDADYISGQSLHVNGGLYFN